MRIPSDLLTFFVFLLLNLQQQEQQQPRRRQRRQGQEQQGLVAKKSLIVSFAPNNKDIITTTIIRMSDNDNNNNINNNEEEGGDGGDDGWETIPSSNTKKKNNRNRKKEQQQPTAAVAAAWTTSPLSVEYMPPTPSNTEFEQCLILLVGLPGSGKSTFSRALEQAMPYKFARVNQDELKTRKKCEIKVKSVLSTTTTCVIIDRCNFDSQQRQTWLGIAEEMDIPVHCIVFQVPVTECIRRCQQRTNHETVSPQEAKRVVNTVQRTYKLPSKEEVDFFKTYMTIQNGDEFNEAILTLLNQK